MLVVAEMTQKSVRSMPRRVMRYAMTALVALVLLFEEWGWEPLAALVASLGRLRFFAWLERRIRALGPWSALCTFAVPAIALIPVKLLALFLIGHGQAWLGVLVLIGAKFAGTALLAWLFSLTQPTLMQMPWFARWYVRWKAWKDEVMEQVRQSAVWRAGKRAKANALVRWAEFRRRISPGEAP